MVVACGSNSTRDLVSFFRIPSEYDNHKQFNKLASERRKAWINRLKRADLTESKIKNGRICSKHFISGLVKKESYTVLEKLSMDLPTDFDTELIFKLWSFYQKGYFKIFNSMGLEGHLISKDLIDKRELVVSVICEW
ncbi:hypothetical protein NQ317_016526 [Molorchus minor]|uniref:THAP-type domain-containing protein n=1 Tax=Molorchus minor TaxID=1323400 RepID=A0ABQ9IPW5_9CUCU|nr:hypothetical protein NQ317_016526 [Molorchus minor]